MRLIVNVLAFMATTIALYVVCMILLAKVQLNGEPIIHLTGAYYKPKGGESFAKFREFDTTGRHDVVFVGSSRVLMGYDPQVFVAKGYSAFNLGTTAQSPMNSLHLIEGYLDSNNTGLVILDVYPSGFSSTGLESAADLVRNVSKDPVAVDLAWSLKDIRGFNLLALRTITRNDPPSIPTPKAGSLGFAPKSTVFDGEGKSITEQRPTREQIDHFMACLAACDRKGVPIVITSHFATPDFQPHHQIDLHHFIDSLLRRTNVHSLDFSHHPAGDANGIFADGRHLNATGARLFTGSLLDSLQARGLLNEP